MVHRVEVRQTAVFAEWLDGLRDRKAQAIIAARIVRVQSGLMGDAKFFHGTGKGTLTMPLETAPFDAAKYLSDPEDRTALLTDAFESGDPAYIANALGVVARARGMSSVAREAGVTREALYKALSESGDPKLSTLLGVMRALGVQLSVKA